MIFHLILFFPFIFWINNIFVEKYCLKQRMHANTSTIAHFTYVKYDDMHIAYSIMYKYKTLHTAYTIIFGITFWLLGILTFAYTFYSIQIYTLHIALFFPLLIQTRAVCRFFFVCDFVFHYSFCTCDATWMKLDFVCMSCSM